MPAPSTVLPEWATDATFPAGSDTWSGQPPRVAAGLAALAATGHIPDTQTDAETFNAWLGLLSEWITFLRTDYNSGRFGDGSDGDVVITGGTTTLSRDMYYDDLTVEATGVLDTNGFRWKASGIATIDVGGLVHNDGSAGADTGAGGSAGPSGSLGGGDIGGTGTGGAGGAGATTTDSIGGAGGAGGASSAFAGGAAGGATGPAGSAGGWRHADATEGYIVGILGLTVLTGGGGGGAGGAEGDDGAGGGGGGGGVSFAAATLVNNGTIRAAGGVGGDGVLGGGDDPGGGGGGGGGFVLAVVGQQSGSGTITAPGGLGGTGGDNAADGDPGSAGTVIVLVG